MKFNIIGDPFGTSGYANHVRGLSTALLKLGHEVAVECVLKPGWELECTDELLVMVKAQHFDDGHSIMIGTPPYYDLVRNDPCASFNGFVIWEGDKIPLHWRKHLYNCDRIFVPSNHVKDAILDTDDIGNDDGFPRIHIVPHGVDLDLFKPAKKKEKRPFRFVVVKGWNKGINDRGGVQWAVKAFCEEFTPEEPVEMYLKINPAYGTLDYKEEILKLGDYTSMIPKITLDIRNLDVKDMPRVYHQGDVFVSATMGEAFNLPVLEAMACGLPTIVTGFGGQIDFAYGAQFTYDLVENTWDLQYEGVRWAKPHVSELRDLMRVYYERLRENDPKYELGGGGPRERAEGYSWEASALKLIQTFK